MINASRIDIFDIFNYLHLKIIILSFSANAVEAMVSKDIVHRDLKPQNILMNHEGRSLKNPQPQDIKLKIGNAKRLENLLSFIVFQNHM